MKQSEQGQMELGMFGLEKRGVDSVQAGLITLTDSRG